MLYCTSMITSQSDNRGKAMSPGSNSGTKRSRSFRAARPGSSPAIVTVDDCLQRRMLCFSLILDCIVVDQNCFR
jgi:hypothetical protein